MKYYHSFTGFVLSFLFLFCSIILQAQNTQIISPEVNQGKTVTFRLKAPNATNVVLAGDLHGIINGWTEALPFRKGDDGIWELTVGPLRPNIYKYNFEVDGVRIIDPSNPEVATGSGISSSVVNVPAEEGPTIYEPRMNVASGVVHRHAYHSKAIDKFREVHIYTPPGYSDASRNQYPVLYLLHGNGDVARTWSELGRANFIMDNLLHKKMVKPMIIVMPNSIMVPRSGEIEEWGNNTDLFEKDLMKSIIPLVESNYKVKKGANNRAIAGLAMGGRQSADIALRNLDKFSSIGVFSSSLNEFETAHADVLNDPSKLNEKLDVFLLTCGALDPFTLSGAKKAHRLLEEKGIKHTYFEMPEIGHSWPFWRHVLAYAFLPELWKEEEVKFSRK